MVSYGSAQTSTSGILVEDVLHLATEDGARENLLKTTSHLDSFSICFGHGGTGSDSIQCEPDPPTLGSQKKQVLWRMKICFTSLNNPVLRLNSYVRLQFHLLARDKLLDKVATLVQDQQKRRGMTPCSIASPYCHSHTSVLTSLMSAFLLYILL
ncbi:hypothetical protein POTOM_019147 [Populus tomentosa]|uniref:Uncharacterized protein n=1 Tax=Populus tomentosa TaxID=118781 RepID=A0A8X7ZQU8_POPTO|nr:hypothetical protein POTOM_019147 [Populus tomentosa]